MSWVIAFTVIFYAIANAPFFYALFCVHGWRESGVLWGYSPHQFLFCLLVFPFACFATLAALYSLLSMIAPRLPDEFAGKWFSDNWPAVLLIGIAVCSVITVADYFSSARSLDKLERPYARAAIDALQNLNEKLNATK